MADAAPTIRADLPRDWAALGREWEALEARAPHAPAFRRWAWVGCLAEERFLAPVLLRLEGPRGETLGLALFNRTGRTWRLGETGEAERDSPFVEHNGPLVAEDAPEGAEAALLRAAWEGAPWFRWGPGRPVRLVLGGVAPALEAAAGGHPWRRQVRPAPFLDLDAVRREAGGDWLATLSANTRQAIRRSDRALAGAGAPPAAKAAESEAEAATFLEELAALHRARFPGGGAHGTPWRARFQRELVRRQLRAGQLELLRVTAGGELVGLLHNLRAGGATLAYQSGWAERPGMEKAKPGLTCHGLAIARALARGDREYDFLAGDQRYKRSLAGGLGGVRELVWAERLRPGLVWEATAWVRSLLRR